jgi:hypothetical protein
MLLRKNKLLARVKMDDGMISVEQGRLSVLSKASVEILTTSFVF